MGIDVVTHVAPSILFILVLLIQTVATFATENRLDFMCCDIEPAKLHAIFCFHPYCKRQTCPTFEYRVPPLLGQSFIGSIAGKLLSIPETLGEWHRSKYGKFYEFAKRTLSSGFDTCDYSMPNLQPSRLEAVTIMAIQFRAAGRCISKP